MSGKKRNQIQCAHFNEEKCGRNENTEEGAGQPEVLAACAQNRFKQKLPRNALKICYICLVGLIISE